MSEWRPLARGGLAVVWEARQLPFDRLVAVKVYQRELDEDTRRRFLGEAAAAGTLSGHPGIVTTYDGGVLPDDRPYFIMQLCPGGSLTRWLKPEHRPSEEQVRQVAVRIADALAAVHASSVLHRDVKPANILIDSYGNPRLADFGLAAAVGADATMADPLHLTPAYAPPEAFELQPAAESGDVYSLAATLYALLAGSPPRRVGAGSIAIDQLAKVAREPIGRLPGVNWHVMEVLMAALSADPASRPTAAEFRDRFADMPAARISKRGLLAGPAGRPSPALTAVPTATADSDQARRSGAGRRVGSTAVAAALVTVIASVTAWQISEPTASGVGAVAAQTAISGALQPSPASSGAPDPTSAPTAAAGYSADSGSVGTTIEVEELAAPAKPAQTVPIYGTYHGGAHTFLRVLRWEAGKWLAFPLPTVTDQSGRFTAYVELAQPGRYPLRVLDPATGVASEPTVLVIKG